jgi:hypothetical protein
VDISVSVARLSHSRCFVNSTEASGFVGATRRLANPHIEPAVTTFQVMNEYIPKLTELRLYTKIATGNRNRTARLGTDTIPAPIRASHQTIVTQHSRM